MIIKSVVSIVLFVLGLGLVGICLFVLVIQAGSNSVSSVFATKGNISSEDYDRVARGLEADLKATCLRPGENGKCLFLALGDADTYQARVEFKDRSGESIYIVQSLPRYPFLLGSFAVEKDHITAEKIILASLQGRLVRADRRVRNMGREKRISLP